METMFRKKPRLHRSFTPEFKAEIVELCRLHSTLQYLIAAQYEAVPGSAGSDSWQESYFSFPWRRRFKAEGHAGQCLSA
jgi:hypothetical protein